MLGRVCVFFSRTQKSVTLSSTEAEYVAIPAGIKETIFLRYMWSFIFPDRDVGCTLACRDVNLQYFTESCMEIGPWKYSGETVLLFVQTIL